MTQTPTLRVRFHFSRRVYAFALFPNNHQAKQHSRKQLLSIHIQTPITNQPTQPKPSPTPCQTPRRRPRNATNSPAARPPSTPPPRPTTSATSTRTSTARTSAPSSPHPRPRSRRRPPPSPSPNLCRSNASFPLPACPRAARRSPPATIFTRARRRSCRRAACVWWPRASPWPCLWGHVRRCFLGAPPRPPNPPSRLGRE